jgi:hypothetical protein
MVVGEGARMRMQPCFVACGAKGRIAGGLRGQPRGREGRQESRAGKAAGDSIQQLDGIGLRALDGQVELVHGISQCVAAKGASLVSASRVVDELGARRNSQGARLWDTFQHHETALRFQQTATGKRQTTSDKHAQTAARRSFCICAAFLLFFPAFQRPAIANVLSKVCKLCRPLSCLVAPLFA